jgi:hypothetical protein
MLVRNGEDAYVLTAIQVKGMVSGLSQNATECIFHETDAASSLYFRTFDDLYRQLLAWFITLGRKRKCTRVYQRHNRAFSPRLSASAVGKSGV